jgi:hypothetical protein
MEIHDSARKHGLADDDIREAYRNLIGEVTDQRKPHFVMFIGETSTSEQLEIGVLDPDDDPLVIHAMKLRRNWRRYLWTQE